MKSEVPPQFQVEIHKPELEMFSGYNFSSESFYVKKNKKNDAMSM